MLIRRVVLSVCAAAGAIVFVVGIVGVIAGGIAFLDPVEAQLTNDPDPFRAPPTRLAIAIRILIYVAAATAGGLCSIGASIWPVPPNNALQATSLALRARAAPERGRWASR